MSIEHDLALAAVEKIHVELPITANSPDLIDRVQAERRTRINQLFGIPVLEGGAKR